MNLARTYTNDVMKEPWINASTARMDAMLMQDYVQDITVSIVKSWNMTMGLGTDLADVLAEFVTLRWEKELSPRDLKSLVGDVHWEQLAEQYAYRFCGVDEAELSRRRADQT